MTETRKYNRKLKERGITLIALVITIIVLLILVGVALSTLTGDSYFVWIPRYVYRITYYSDANYKNVAGFYDGWGMWKAEDGAVKYELEQGIESVTYNGNKYIVHPAFMNDTNKNGENEGEGFNTTFRSIPRVRSAKKIINNMYTVSLGYDKNKESYLIKNSEWGAVYINEGTDFDVKETLYLVGKEVRMSSSNLNWFSDASIYVMNERPFFGRGGRSKNSGVFSSRYYDSNFNSYTSFRVVLAE